MPNEYAIVIFRLDEQSYALNCNIVRRIHQVVEITAVPNAPKDILGIVNVEGEIIHIIDIRQRLGLISCAISLKDFIIIVDSSSGSIGFIVNEIDFMTVSDNDIEKNNPVYIIKLPNNLAYMLDEKYLMKEYDSEKLSAAPSLQYTSELNTGI